jgi:hypothetical protein
MWGRPHSSFQARFDLNHALKSVWGSEGRAESKWELVSHKNRIWNLFNDPQEACQVSPSPPRLHLVAPKRERLKKPSAFPDFTPSLHARETCRQL